MNLFPPVDRKVFLFELPKGLLFQQQERHKSKTNPYQLVVGHMKQLAELTLLWVQQALRYQEKP